MNKAILEIVKGQWHISKAHAEVYMPLVLKVLNGDTVEMPKPVLNVLLISEATGQQSMRQINPDTWDNNPNSLFEDITEETSVIFPVNGAITKYDNCGIYGAQTYSKVIGAAAAHQHITGAILKIDSPGGSADGSFDFADAVKEFAATGKPIVAFIDGLGASAAYRIAAQATAVIAKPGSLLGSIGTMTSFIDNSKAMLRMGYKRVDIYATDSTEKNQESREAEKGNYDLIRENILDPMNNIFLQEMRDARNLPERALTGRIYTPEEALKDNLIDQIGTMRTAMDALQQRTGRNPSTGAEIRKKPKPKASMKLGQAILSFLGLTEQPEQLSEEQLQQLEGLAGENARLSSLVTSNQDEIKALGSQVIDLNEQLAEAKDHLECITNERDAFKQLAEEYGARPGAEPTVVKSKADGEHTPAKSTDSYWDRQHQKAKAQETEN